VGRAILSILGGEKTVKKIAAPIREELPFVSQFAKDRPGQCRYWTTAVALSISPEIVASYERSERLPLQLVAGFALG